MKHTQGNWKVDEIDSSLEEIFIINEEKAIATALSGYSKNGITDEEAEANAKIISAAPDLLAAAQMAREELVLGGDWKTAQAKLDEAIKKATI